MKRVVNKLSPTKVEVVCSIEKDVWATAKEKAFQKLAKDVKIPGFRKGKVPADMARKYIDNGKVLYEAANSLFQPSFLEVIKEEKLIPAVRPSGDIDKISDDELSLKFTIVLPPSVKLSAYKELGIKLDKVEVSDKDIDEEINKVVAQNANLVVSDKPAKVGDTVVIDFVGSVDGKEFEGGKADNYSLELGSNSFVPGFEDQLVGVKSGDDVDVNVTFPEQYVAELAGKKALFKCKVHEVKEKVLPELNEELIKELNIPDVKDVDSLRAHFKTQLHKNKESAAKGKLLNNVIDSIVEKSTFEIDPEIIDEEVKAALKNMEEQIKQKGLTVEQYLQISGQTKEKYEENCKAECVKNIKAAAAIEQIATIEKIDVSDKDVEAQYEKIANQYKMEVGKVKEILSKDIERFKNQIRQEKISDFLITSNSK